MTARAKHVERPRGTRCCVKEGRPKLTATRAASVSRTLEVLAHPVRLQLLDVLARNDGRVCVCDLEAAVDVKQPTVSHHLKLLRAAGIVDSERRGVWAHYFLKADALAALRSEAIELFDTLVPQSNRPSAKKERGR